MTSSIDLTTETAIGLSDAARRYPPLRGGRPVNPATILRWITDAIRARDGRCVRLEAVRVGGRWLTSVEALARFTESLSAVPAADPAPVRTPAQRLRASERAAAELERVGI